MKVYRVELQSHEENSQGFMFFSSKREAVNCESNWTEQGNNPDHFASTHEFSFPLTREGVLNILNRVGVHPDNG